MTDVTDGPAGVPLRDHDVRLPVSPADATTASREHRERMTALVGSLSADEWAAPSRCGGWSVQDVVRHLTHINDLILRTFAAAESGERVNDFATFDPRVTPRQWIDEAGPEEPTVTADAYAASTQRITDVAERLLATGSEVRAMTPAGKQPWPRALLHALFDTAVHERDILGPIGRVQTPAASDTESRAVAGYELLLSGRILGVLGAPADIGLRLGGGPDLRLRVDGPLVAVDFELGDAPAVLTGERDPVLDAMAGRGELSEVLAGPSETVALLGALRTLL